MVHDAYFLTLQFAQFALLTQVRLLLTTPLLENNLLLIDRFAILRKERRRARPILTALAIIGNYGISSASVISVWLVSRLHLLVNSSYLLFICTFQELHDTCLVW